MELIFLRLNGGGARLYRGGARLDEVGASLDDGVRWS